MKTNRKQLLKVFLTLGVDHLLLLFVQAKLVVQMGAFRNINLGRLSKQERKRVRARRR